MFLNNFDIYIKKERLEIFMTIAAVIAEYNPFHNGHKYQLDKIREETHSDYIIVAMSGNFVQRGTPAFLDKYLRTETALKCGADLVLEIPVIGATASAESFANAGVSILNSTGVVSYLCYGVEKKSDIISKIASFLRNPSTKFNEKLATYTKSGDSFPVARSKALCNFFPDEEKAAVEDILKTPNIIFTMKTTIRIIRSCLIARMRQRNYSLMKISLMT